MKEDFVTYELAVKLKEKGFNDECHAYYEPLKHCLNLSRVFKKNSLAENYNCITAPTISQVLKWLREEKKIYIEIWWLTQHTTKNLKGFQFVVTPLCENPQRETDLELYCDYETAAIKGIEYVIDNLI